MAREDELRPIEGYGGLSAQKSGAGEMSPLSFKDAQPAQAPKAQAAKPIETSDKIEISEDLKDYGNSDTTRKDVDALKKHLAEMGGSTGLAPSPAKNYQGLLDDDLGALKSEQSDGTGAFGNMAIPSNTGYTPGMQGGGVYNSVGGYQGDAAPGMGQGGVFVSPGARETGAQPGGGTASPNTVKLQENFADSLKSGAQIMPETEQKVLDTLATRDGAAPLQSLLGLGDRQR